VRALCARVVRLCYKRWMKKESCNYEDLLVWQKSMDLVEKVYLVTKRFFVGLRKI